jgi:hypothetical protein
MYASRIIGRKTKYSGGRACGLQAERFLCVTKLRRDPDRFGVPRVLLSVRESSSMPGFRDTNLPAVDLSVGQCYHY